MTLRGGAAHCSAAQRRDQTGFGHSRSRHGTVPHTAGVLRIPHRRHGLSRDGVPAGQIGTLQRRAAGFGARECAVEVEEDHVGLFALDVCEHILACRSEGYSRYTEQRYAAAAGLAVLTSTLGVPSEAREHAPAAACGTAYIGGAAAYVPEPFMSRHCSHDQSSHTMHRACTAALRCNGDALQRYIVIVMHSSAMLIAMHSSATLLRCCF